MAVLAALLADGSVTANTEPATIVGGDAVGPCAWPSVVSLGRVCTGTLVHPRLVVYAAHCGDAFTSVEFGNASAPRHARTVATSHCGVHPDGLLPGAGRDFAYCVLETPQYDVPIVPALMGCEAEALTVGADVTLVGFGQSEVGYGDKRAVTTAIAEVAELEIRVGGEGRDTCEGDSGGPAFVQLEGGQWRVFGVTSYGDACGDGGYVSLMHQGAAWIEETAGIEITPCFDGGNWWPTEACGGFATNPSDDLGDWLSGCAQDPSGLGQTCGPAFDDQGDTTPPTVEFDDPMATDVSVHAYDDGVGVHAIALRIDSEPVGVRWSSTATFELALAAGEHELVAVATDRAGNEARAILTVVTEELDEDADAVDGSTSGCTCRQATGPGDSGILLWGWMFSFAWVSRSRTRT